VAEAQSRLRDYFPDYGSRGSLTDAPAETPRTALLEQYGSIVEPYEPSLSERIYNFAFDALGGNTATGLDRQRILRRARYPQKIIDQTALAGITDYSQAMQDYARGDALSGTTNLAMAATSLIPGQQRQAAEEIANRLLKGTFGRTLDTSNIQIPLRPPQTDVPTIPLRSDKPPRSPIEPQTDVPVDQEWNTQDTYYHLTNKDFDEFIPGGPEGIDNQGAVFLTPNPEQQSAGHNVRHDSYGANVRPVQIKVSNPLYIDQFNKKEMTDRWANGNPEFPYIVDKAVADRLNKAGFDHIVNELDESLPEIAVLNPENIRPAFKSALRNLTDTPAMPDDRVISPDQLMPGLQGMIERRVLDNTPENLDQYIRFKGGKINAQPKPLVADVLSGISRILAPKTVTPEDLYKQGSPLIGVLGDRTDANVLLTGADGMQFENPIPLEGGYKFMQTNPEEKGVWASNRGEVKKLEGQIQRAGGEANLVYTPMAETGGDFSTMMTDSLFERIKNSKITKKNKAIFDTAVRAKIPEWKGVDHPEARFQLQRVGALRHIFNGLVGRDEFQKMGFPDLATSRFSITAPELVGVPTLHGGQAIGRTQGKRVESPLNPHGSYDTQQLGEYVGGLPIATPAQVMFPDFFGIRRLAGKPVSGDYRAYQLGEVVQEPNQQWLDGMMKYYESVEPR
jgi:hypothetical protein